MIRDPARRGAALAAFFASVEPRLFADLEEAGVLADPSDPVRVRDEWACFALYACVRGLIAAGGFNRETATAVETFHERAVAAWWNAEALPGDLRARIAERYAEYGTIGQAGGASAAATVGRRLGDAAARHMAGEDAPGSVLAEMVGALHESLAEGAAEAVRQGE